MKLSDIKIAGFYWNRADDSCAWTVVFVKRRSLDPNNKYFNSYGIDGAVTPRSQQMGQYQTSEAGEFRGPVLPPSSPQIKTLADEMRELNIDLDVPVPITADY